jgi:acetyltransferase (GNAT) family protein
MASLVLQPISALNKRHLAQVLAVYETSFSPDFRVPFTELTEAGDADQTFVALEGPDAVGFAALRLLGSVGWSFLRYFAIAGERRSQGLGRQFWQRLQRSLADESWPTRIVFEVEVPDETADNDAERLIRQRRIAFWTVCGAQLLPAPGYILPDFTESGTAEPMLLMAAAPAATPLPQGDQLRSLVSAIYTDRYYLQPGHPLVSRALASITG